MEAEIIAVGTEILLGEIVNTNASFVAKQLATLGITSHFQQVVGDNGERLDDAISLAQSRSDLVILIGGLGPTPDDLTKQVLSAHIGKPLVVNFKAIDKLIKWGKQQQRELTDNNRIQAMLPLDATPLDNEIGLAVGAMTEAFDTQFVLLPGPPKEMEPMVINQLVPRLLDLQADHQILVSRVLRFYGIGESALVTELADVIDGQDNPTIASYVKDYEVTLRLTARADSDEAALALLAPMEETIMGRVGEYFYGYGDHNSLAQTVVEALKSKAMTITAAESLTAGAFQAALGDVAGVSAVFNGGFVTYAEATKAKFLGINQVELAEHGVVSEFTAKAMATGALNAANATLAISFTGVAGPEELEGQPAGTVWIGVAHSTGVSAQVFHFPGSRQDVRYRAVKQGLFMALRAIQAH
ncbi:competence/damage-inducible protein A [Lacticaseibacillus brantae]|uniref:Putative competence-damage inducible protein n=1 Tax=Lacticaseibacillus brantae DSM 23927 TaxID=1423727 RepID=A0A0R2AZF6_9LACO|nr:competence/damage-inducible protein A [Lacticaseibacillus brantae]KRM72335.1 competence damage-inducible protein a [Lacticaseibacillus brantae DSM 23927]